MKPLRSAAAPASPNKQSTTKSAGDDGEERALDYLVKHGMRPVARNYRTPGRGGGEIDLVMRDRDGTLVFVEVRKRATGSHGGAAASIGYGKQRRIILAARHFLMRLRGEPPPCRFDVIGIEHGDVEWLKAAFDAG